MDTNKDILELCKQIEAISRKTGQGIHQSFDLFLGVIDEGLKRLMVRDWQWKPAIENYEKIEEELAQGFAVLVKQVCGEITYQDIIGSAYMQLNIGNTRAGQYFTPWAVAKMMAMVNIGTPDLTKYTQKDPMTICDPCCGSGIMLLAAASCLPREFINEGRVVFSGCDIDQTCVTMARINCNLYGLTHPWGFIKPTQELTEEEIQRFPEPYKKNIQQTLFDLEEVKKK